MAKTAIIAVLGAFLIFYVIASPDQAADIARGIGHLTAKVAHGIKHFVDDLAS